MAQRSTKLHDSELTDRGTQRTRFYGLGTKETASQARLAAMRDISKECKPKMIHSEIYKRLYDPCKRSILNNCDEFKKEVCKKYSDRFDIIASDLFNRENEILIGWQLSDGKHF